MPGYIARTDLLGVKVDALEGGSFSVQARCVICREIVRLHLPASEAEMGREATSVCTSGKDWPRTFELHARFSPDEVDEEDGVDIWGLIYEKEN